MSRRVVILQPYVPRYRAPLYTQLSEVLAVHGIELSVATSRKSSARGDGSDFAALHIRDFLESPTRGRLRLRDVGQIRRLGVDFLILEQAIKNLETYPLLAITRRNSPSIALWGHGRSFSKPQGRPLAALKQWTTRRSDWFFAYTEASAGAVIDNGFPAGRVTVLRNTLDDVQLRNDLDSVTDQDRQRFARAHGIGELTALFLGGVDRLKAVDYVVDMAIEAGKLSPDFTLLVGGAGDDAEHVRQAERRGAPVRLLGRLDGKAKAIALDAAKVLVCPSQIGLVAVDSLISARPLVTRYARFHGPEASYLQPGRDSVWFGSDTSPKAFASGLIDLLRDDRRMETLSVACRAEAPKYRMVEMVDRFASGIMGWTESLT